VDAWGKPRMSDARTAILARLTAAQRTAHLPPVDHTPRSLEPVSRPPAECLARFREELTLLGVDNFVETSPGGVRERVQQMVAGQRVLAWDDAHLPYELGSIVGEALRGSSPRAAQAQAEIGVTGCEAAIAETGSLAVISGPGRSRAISLLPATHLAVVRTDDLLFSMGDFFRTRGRILAEAAGCVVITGPSRTADIELTLTLGVHGPGRVIVVIGP
jgi:L-lactate dehydrogenase complex protein LldG